MGVAPRQSGCLTHNQRPVEVSIIMRALDPEVFDAVWAAIEPLVPVLVDMRPYAFEWGARVRMRGALGGVGQVTPPAWRSTRRR